MPQRPLSVRLPTQRNSCWRDRMAFPNPVLAPKGFHDHFTQDSSLLKALGRMPPLWGFTKHRRLERKLQPSKNRTADGAFGEKAVSGCLKSPRPLFWWFGSGAKTPYWPAKGRSAARISRKFGSLRLGGGASGIRTYGTLSLDFAFEFSAEFRFVNGAFL
jgi:hypothetical protein